MTLYFAAKRMRPPISCRIGGTSAQPSVLRLGSHVRHSTATDPAPGRLTCADQRLRSPPSGAGNDEERRHFIKSIDRPLPAAMLTTPLVRCSRCYASPKEALMLA